MKSTFLRVAPYAEDALNLPVENVEAALPFYQNVMGFNLVSQDPAKANLAILGRDAIQIGLAENGGDPSQEGAFIEVDNAETAYAELKANGLPTEANFRLDQHGETKYKVFFVVAPDGLCYCLGERQD